MEKGRCDHGVESGFTVCGHRRVERAGRGAFALATLTLVLVAAACAREADCTEDNAPITTPDGGAMRCGGPEDCRRPSNFLYCDTDAPIDECVACVETRCVVRAAASCR